jgi:hypothetical protein
MHPALAIWVIETVIVSSGLKENGVASALVMAV